MAAGQGKIILDADASKVVQEAKKGGDAFKQAAREAAGLGGQFDKWGKQLAKTVVSVGAVAKAIAAVGQEIAKAQREGADANRKAGGEALDRGISAARLGISAGDANALAAPGARSSSEIDALLSSLVGQKQKPGGGGVDRKSIFRAVNLFRTGGFDKDEITAALENGTLDELERGAGARMDAIGSDAQGELGARGIENSAAADAQARRAARGSGARIGQARRDQRNAAHPVAGAFQNIVGSATSVVGGDSIIEASDVAINANTAELKQLNASMAPKPKLAPGVE